MLIAVTARSIGATVFTSDGSDFEAVNEAFPFDLEIVANEPKSCRQFTPQSRARL